VIACALESIRVDSISFDAPVRELETTLARR
jgi:hypothetical protein